MRRILLSISVAAALLAQQGATPHAPTVLAAQGQVLLQAPPPPKPRFTVTDLGTVGGWCEGHAISNNGQVAGYCFGGSSYQAFLWKDGVMQGLGTLGGASSRAYGVNDAGQVAGDSDTASGHRAFLWQNGAMVDLGAPTAGLSVARAINSAGKVVGTTAALPAYHGHGFLWSGVGSWTDLGSLDPDNDSQALAVNDLGQVAGFGVVGVYPDIQYHVFRWNGSMQDLGNGGHRYAQALGMNDNGDIVGSMSDGWSGPSYAFVAKGSGIQSLGGAGSHAFDINNDGLIVGESGGQAVLWEDGLQKNLNTLIDPASGWDLTSARAINERGQITGYGTHNGQKGAFLLTTNAYYWNKPAGGAWNLATNWDPTGIPGDGDTAVFALSGQYAVNAAVVAAAEASSTPLLNRIVISGTGTVELNNLNFALTSDSPIEPGITVDDGGTAVVNSGAASFTHAVVGGLDPPNPASAPIARLQVFNSGTSMTGSGRLTIGDKGAGDLFVANGGHLTSAEARLGGTRPGTAVVGGDGSLWETGNIAVGYGVSGTLTIENGGRVDSNTAVVGFGPYSGLSQVVVDGKAPNGSESLWAVNGDLTIGENGAGEVEVKRGAQLAVNQNIFIKDGALNVRTPPVSGIDSRLYVQGHLMVGGKASATGVFQLDDGGQGEIDGNLVVGQGGEGVMVVAGTGDPAHLTGLSVADANAGLCAFGRGFDAVVGISDGGYVACRNVQIAQAGTNGAGHVGLSGGALIALELVRVGEVGSGPALVVMEASGSIAAELDGGHGVYIAPTGVVTGTGVLVASGVGLVNDGKIHPGIRVVSGVQVPTASGVQAGAASLTISGTLTMSPTGRLEVPVTGTGAGQYGSLSVTGAARLDGVLELDFGKGFAPKKGDVFTFLTAAGGVTGAFESVTIQGLMPGFTHKVTTTGGKMVLEALNDGVAAPLGVVHLPLVQR